MKNSAFKLILPVYIICFLQMFSSRVVATAYITYEYGYGRFGDQLVSYMHAKWLAYKYGLSFLYRPFSYSDRLILDDIEERCASENFRGKTIIVETETVLQRGIVEGALYVVSYFPESSYERKTWQFPGFQVDWSDENFKSLLQASVAPKVKNAPFLLPKDKKTVALHIRRGGGYDVGTYEQFHKGYPTKFPNEEFYAEALEYVYMLLGQQELYVFIFTDDQCPDKIVEKFEKIFEGKRIIFDYRRTKNAHNANVLEDFFALTQFDCLIRSDSNFSLCASKLKKYLVHIAPKDCEVINGKMVVSSLAVDAL